MPASWPASSSSRANPPDPAGDPNRWGLQVCLEPPPQLNRARQSAREFSILCPLWQKKGGRGDQAARPPSFLDGPLVAQRLPYEPYKYRAATLDMHLSWPVGPVDERGHLRWPPGRPVQGVHRRAGRGRAWVLPLGELLRRLLGLFRMRRFGQRVLELLGELPHEDFLQDLGGPLVLVV